MYRTLLESYQHLQQEMASVAAEWQDCEKRIDDYVDEQVHTCTKTRMHSRQKVTAFLYMYIWNVNIIILINMAKSLLEDTFLPLHDSNCHFAPKTPPLEKVNCPEVEVLFVILLQLLFKVEGQSLTNQRTEPHKSLISKNVRF